MIDTVSTMAAVSSGVVCLVGGIIIGRLRNGAEYWQRLYVKAELARVSLQAERERRLAPLKAANAKRSAEAQASRHLRMDVAEKRLRGASLRDRGSREPSPTVSGLAGFDPTSAEIA